jgi:hypothetical protein
MLRARVLLLRRLLWCRLTDLTRLVRDREILDARLHGCPLRPDSGVLWTRCAVLAGEEDRLVTILPAHHVVLVTGFPADIEDLASSRRLPDTDAVHEDLVTNSRCFHRDLTPERAALLPLESAARSGRGQGAKVPS